MMRDEELAAAAMDVLGSALAVLHEAGAALAASPPSESQTDTWLATVRSTSEDALVVVSALAVIIARWGPQRP